MNTHDRSVLMRFIALLAAVSIAVLLTACGGDDDESDTTAAETTAAETTTAAADEGTEEECTEPTKVRYLLPYQESISFTGFLLAQDRFFAEECLEVEAVSTNGADYVAQQLIAGNAEFGQTGAQNILIANSKGAELRGLAQIGGRGIFTIVAPADSDVKSVEDLKGKSLGVTDLGGGEMPMVRAAIADAGLTEGKDIEVIPVGEGGPSAFNAIQSGQVAAYAGANNDLAGMVGAGLDPVDIRSDVFKNIPTTEVTVTQETLDDPEKREIAIKLARAYRKGAEWAVANPDEALEISCGIVPEECTNMDVAQAFMDSVLEAYAVPEGLDNYAEHGPKATYDLVQESLAADEISEPQDLAVAFPDEYMDEITQD